MSAFNNHRVYLQNTLSKCNIDQCPVRNNRAKTKKKNQQQRIMGTDARKRSNFEDDIDHKYWDMKVILFVFKIIGLAPLEILKSDWEKKNSDKRASQIPVRLKFVYFRSGLIYNVILFIAYLFISYICIPRCFRTDYEYMTILTAGTDVALAVSRITLMNALWLLTSIKRDRIIRLLNRFIEVDSIICRLSDSRWISVFRLRVISVFIVLIIVWVVLVITDRLAYNTTILDCFNDIVPSFVINLFIFQYALMIEFIEIRYRNLNSAVVNLSTSFLIVKTFRSFTNHGEINLINNRDYIPNIIDFRRAHSTLCEIGSDIAEFYSLPILFIIPLCFLEIIYSAYCALLPLTHNLSGNPTFDVTTSVAWVLVLITPVAVLTKRVDGISNEMRKTSDAIYKVLDGSNLSREDEAKLERFSVELLHRKIDFTAYGLFPLDSSLVNSIISAMITYLVILFQFQIYTIKS